MHLPIYADFNGTTPTCPAAQAWMSKAIECWGNPSSIHKLGQASRGLLDEARGEVARACERKPGDVVFTSGGSEANTLALLGSVLGNTGYRVLSTPVEHSSVRDTCALISRLGATVEMVKIDPSGQLNWPDFLAKLDSFKPQLVSIMTANNETGVVFPLPEIVAECRSRKILVHTDAVQGFGKLPAAFWNQADFVSISAHKILGPKGAGALLIHEGLKLENTHFGGGQETKRRGGTENIVGISGFAGACTALKPEAESVAGLRDLFEAKLHHSLSDLVVMGAATKRLPNTSQIQFSGVSSEVLLSALDLDGLYVSAGSACSSGSLKPSPVLLAMGLSESAARECLRFSWGPLTTEAEVVTAANLVAGHVTRIRERKSR